MSVFGGFPFYSADTIEIGSTVLVKGSVLQETLSLTLGPVPGQVANEKLMSFGYSTRTLSPGHPSGATTIGSVYDGAGANPWLSLSYKTVVDGTTNSGTYANEGVMRSFAARVENGTFSTHIADVVETSATSITIPNIATAFPAGSVALIFVAWPALNDPTVNVITNIDATFPTWAKHGGSRSNTNGAGSVLRSVPVASGGFIGGTIPVPNGTSKHTYAVVVFTPTG